MSDLEAQPHYGCLAVSFFAAEHRTTHIASKVHIRKSQKYVPDYLQLLIPEGIFCNGGMCLLAYKTTNCKSLLRRWHV